jgi:hypothetical protein
MHMQPFQLGVLKPTRTVFEDLRNIAVERFRHVTVRIVGVGKDLVILIHHDDPLFDVQIVNDCWISRKSCAMVAYLLPIGSQFHQVWRHG